MTLRALTEHSSSPCTYLLTTPRQIRKQLQVRSPGTLFYIEAGPKVASFQSVLLLLLASHQTRSQH